MSATCPACGQYPKGVTHDCKPTTPPASPRCPHGVLDAHECFVCTPYVEPEAAPSVGVDNGQTYDVLPDGRLCIPESKPPSDWEAQRDASDALPNGKNVENLKAKTDESYQAVRDAAAEAYAPVTHIFKAGADWALSWYRTEGAGAFATEHRRQQKEIERLTREQKTANDKILDFRHSMSFHGQRSKEEIERLTAKRDEYARDLIAAYNTLTFVTETLGAERDTLRSEVERLKLEGQQTEDNLQEAWRERDRYKAALLPVSECGNCGGCRDAAREALK